MDAMSKRNVFGLITRDVKDIWNAEVQGIAIRRKQRGKHKFATLDRAARPFDILFCEAGYCIFDRPFVSEYFPAFFRGFGSGRYLHVVEVT
jgi:hypothetical protein